MNRINLIKAFSLALLVAACASDGNRGAKSGTKIGTDTDWTDYNSTKTYPETNSTKSQDWYVGAVAPDFSSISFVDKNAVVRNGDSVEFDAWKFNAKPAKVNLYDSSALKLTINCNTMKGRMQKISLLRGNTVISEKSVNLEGFDPGTEPYAIGQSVCSGKYLLPMPAQPEVVRVRKVLESMKSDRK